MAPLDDVWLPFASRFDSPRGLVSEQPRDREGASVTEWTGGLHRLVTIPAVYDWIQRALGGSQARENVACHCLIRAQAV